MNFSPGKRSLFQRSDPLTGAKPFFCLDGTYKQYFCFMKSIPLLLLFSFLFTCTPAQENAGFDCYETFFTTAAKVKNTATIKLLVNKKQQTLAHYLKTEVEGLEHRMALKDLDSDGRAELIIYNFTGGAHCCDEWYFFKTIGPNQYAPAARLFAGNTCISGNTFLFDFAEPFGYFY